MNFSEQLKMLRKSKGLTQEDLAKLMGVSRSTIAGYEALGKQPDFDKLNWLSSFFNVSIDQLVNELSVNENNKITSKDEKDIAKDVNSIMDKIASGEDGPIYYNGEEMDEEDADLFKAALEVALRSIKIENKQKYTPKKYRK